MKLVSLLYFMEPIKQFAKENFLISTSSYNFTLTGVYTFLVTLCFESEVTLTPGADIQFQSPNYPRNYANSLNCWLVITTHPSYIITLSFTFFDTESCCDYLNVSCLNCWCFRTKRSSFCAGYVFFKFCKNKEVSTRMIHKFFSLLPTPFMMSYNAYKRTMVTVARSRSPIESLCYVNKIPSSYSNRISHVLEKQSNKS